MGGVLDAGHNGCSVCEIQWSKSYNEMLKHIGWPEDLQYESPTSKMAFKIVGGKSRTRKRKNAVLVRLGRNSEVLRRRAPSALASGVRIHE